MAVDIKVAPDEKLELVQTYITDTNPNSDYFHISELPDTFSGGKNAFLIAGSDKLLANTEIKIQIRDADGKVCYVEYAHGSIPFYDITQTPPKLVSIGDYYEGNSKVVAVYVYPNLTSFGPATITILGQAKDVPQEWNGLYSVKWTKQVNINPALPNTTRVRFYKKPAVSIIEIVEPLYTIVSGSKTPSLIQGSFASIKVNQLETFAGDVKRIKVYRTAQGDISDYDLIQDILVESKNLLTTYALSGSVVGNGGLFTNESLSKLWKTGSLHAVLDSTYVNDGLQLTGSGNLTYSSSLNLLSSNTYELELDSYFTGSANSSSSNLGIYVSYPTQSLITDKNPTPQPYTLNTTIAILSGSIPAKKFGTQTFPFNITNDYPSASLYLSQSSGTSQWHVGNISLNVSQDTAFSPNEISFVTSMPTVLTNETFNFKFEFYDVNNNYVPVAVTQSALFVGGTNFNTLQSSSLFLSASTSASLTALSQSVSGTIGNVTASVSQSFVTSSAYSASLQSSSLYISSSLSSSISSSKGAAISSSFGNIQTLANGNFSGSFISDTTIFAPVIGGNTGYISSLFKVGTTPSIYLDARQTPRKIFIGGVADVGSYNSGSTQVYMDSDGKFSLGDKLTWSGTTLTLAGSINITGGQAATDIANAASSGSAALTYAVANNATASAAAAAAAANWALINANTSSISAAATAAGYALINANTASIFTDSTGKINKTPATGTQTGLFLGDSYMGYYNGSAWKTYMQNNGNFYLSGTNGYLSWNAGADTLGIKGDIIATNITATTAGNIAGWITDASTFKKSNGTYTTSLNSSDSSIKITLDSTQQDKIKIYPADSIPPITTAYTDTITFNKNGGVITSSPGSGGGSSGIYTSGSSGRSDNTNGTGYNNVVGIPPNTSYANIGDIFLIYPTEEIWVDASTIQQSWFSNIWSASNINSYGNGDTANGYYSLSMRVRKFANYSDCANQVNPVSTWSQTLVTVGMIIKDGSLTQTISISGGAIRVDANNNWFHVDFTEGGYWSATDFVTQYPNNLPLTISMNHYYGSPVVNFGQVGNGYSVIAPAGFQSYGGVQQYFLAAIPSGQSGATTNFFEVKGKSSFLSGLTVVGSFSATTKQFQITHPLNENKWLYHTSMEAPRADLTYRGKIQLNNGFGSASIDIQSNMTIGTFDVLTKNSQLFLQNNQNFDRVKGYINSGSVYVESENKTSNIEIDWSIIAERNDYDVLNGGTYDTNGNYKTEKIKTAYHLEKYAEYLEVSSSI